MKSFLILRRKAHVAASLASEAMRVGRERGLFAAAKYGMVTVRAVLREVFLPPKPRKVNIMDAQFGTDTTQNVKLHKLDISGPNYQHAVYYRPTDVHILTEILDRLDVGHEDYTFIDYGSGKGLVLLQAAAFPFKKVIGVEFARELHETAQRNVEKVPAELLRTEVELVHGDAVEFMPPPGNLILYFYEPFEATVLRQVIARIREFRRGRDLVVVHVRSKNHRIGGNSKSLWDREAFLTPVSEGDGWTIYRSKE